MKRFTETDKWHDPWFRKLNGPEKLVFIFLIENCNNAGFYEWDGSHVAYLTGLEVKHVEGALKALERGIKGASGWVWIRNFLRHQKNDDLNAENPAHRQIIGLLKVQMERFSDVAEFKAFVGPLKGLLSPIGNGTGKGEGRKESAERKPKPESPEIEEYVASIGLPKSDGQWFLDKCIGNGWKNDGRAILDWKATIRAWKTAGYLPSLKSGTGNKSGDPMFSSR